MGGRDLPTHEKKKPRKGAKKVSRPILESEAGQVEVVRPKRKRGEA